MILSCFRWIILGCYRMKKGKPKTIHKADNEHLADFNTLPDSSEKLSLAFESVDEGIRTVK
jgi:hypothetical protein